MGRAADARFKWASRLGIGPVLLGWVARATRTKQARTAAQGAGTARGLRRRTDEVGTVRRAADPGPASIADASVEPGADDVDATVVLADGAAAGAAFDETRWVGSWSWTRATRTGARERDRRTLPTTRRHVFRGGASVFRGILDENQYPCRTPGRVADRSTVSDCGREGACRERRGVPRHGAHRHTMVAVSARRRETRESVPSAGSGGAAGLTTACLC